MTQANNPLGQYFRKPGLNVALPSGVKRRWNIASTVRILIVAPDTADFCRFFQNQERDARGFELNRGADARKPSPDNEGFDRVGHGVHGQVGPS